MLSGTAAAAKSVGSPGQEGTCPNPYSIAFSDGTPFEYKDRNGNGFVCTWVKNAFNGPPHIQAIDDKLNKP